MIFSWNSAFVIKSGYAGKLHWKELFGDLSRKSTFLYAPITTRDRLKKENGNATFKRSSSSKPKYSLATSKTTGSNSTTFQIKNLHKDRIAEWVGTQNSEFH